MRNLSNFGETLTELMITKEKTAKELAEIFSVNVSTIYSWKNCDSSPSLSQLLIISDYFKLPLDYLAGRSDSVSPFPNKECPPFSKRLREVMKENKISTYYMRKNTKFSGNHFSGWDHGSVPSLPTLIDLADLFGCTIDYLVGRDR